MYHLPKGYKRQKPIDFDDTVVVTDGPGSWEWQPDVVPFAADLATLGDVVAIVDVGCGSAEKWRPYADDFVIAGIDRREITSKITAPVMRFAADLESGDPLPVNPDGVLLVCSDVIEHMVDPVQLLYTLKAALLDGAEALVLSTPDRRLTRGARGDRGPCPNKHHAQEWSLDELVAFMEEHGFIIEHAGHTRSNDHEPDVATSLIVATA